MWSILGGTKVERGGGRNLVLGQILFEIGNKGRGTQKKGVQDDPTSRSGPPSLCFRFFCLVQNICQRCSGYFSQYKKEVCKQQNLKEHGEQFNTLYLYKLGHLAINKSATCEVHKAQTNMLTRGRSWGRQGSDTHHPMHHCFAL